MRIIKKYPNRRLYDTSLGSYITLDDVKKLVFEHSEFQVVDARTQKDLTQATLLQIIMEQESSTTPIFTTAVLQELIRFYNEKSQHMFGNYLEQMMGLFQQQKNFLQQQWQTYEKFVINPTFLEQTLKFQKMWSMGGEDESKTSKNPQKKP